MTARYMLDTDVVSYVVKDRPIEYRRRLEEIPVEQFCVSAITAGELFAGLQQYGDEHRLWRSTEAFLRRFRIMPWDESVAPVFARVHFTLAGSGQSIGEMDTLIAAHAPALDLPLVTGNVRHHGRVSGLTVIDWREPIIGG